MARVGLNPNVTVRQSCDGMSQNSAGVKPYLKHRVGDICGPLLRADFDHYVPQAPLLPKHRKNTLALEICSCVDSYAKWRTILNP